MLLLVSTVFKYQWMWRQYCKSCRLQIWQLTEDCACFVREQTLNQHQIYLLFVIDKMHALLSPNTTVALVIPADSSLGHKWKCTSSVSTTYMLCTTLLAH